MTENLANAVTEGRIAMCSGPRKIIDQALSRFPEPMSYWSMPTGRSEANSSRRATPDFGVDVPVSMVDISGTLDECVAGLPAALPALAETAQ